jgi:ATP-dependent RNA helicase DDX24/MAK5
MVEKGHFQELEGIFGVINTDPEVSKKRQNFVFSATLSFTHEPPERLHKGSVKKSKQPKKLTSKEKLGQIMNLVGVRENPKVVDITSKKGTADSLTEMQITCSMNQKDYYLYYFFLQHPGKTIVFSNSINCVRRLTNLFFHLKCETLPLHSEMHQKMRLRNLERFSASEKGILISTDVAARGLDINNIQYVIHYQVPKTAESYIHRSGRTARVSKDGLAVILVQPDETTTFWNIFRSLDRDEMLPDFQVNSKVFREITTQVDLANKVETFEHMLRKKFADMNWMEKARKDLDLASSDEDSDEDNRGGKKQMRKDMEKSRKQLEVSKRKLAELMESNTNLFRQYN